MAETIHLGRAVFMAIIGGFVSVIKILKGEQMEADALSDNELKHIVDMILSGYFYDTFAGDNGDEIKFFLTISKNKRDA